MVLLQSQQVLRETLVLQRSPFFDSSRNAYIGFVVQPLLRQEALEFSQLFTQTPHLGRKRFRPPPLSPPTIPPLPCRALSMISHIAFRYRLLPRANRRCRCVNDFCASAGRSSRVVVHNLVVFVVVDRVHGVWGVRSASEAGNVAMCRRRCSRSRFRPSILWRCAARLIARGVGVVVVVVVVVSRRRTEARRCRRLWGGSSSGSRSRNRSSSSSSSRNKGGTTCVGSPQLTRW